MAAYLDVDGFKLRSVMPSEEVALIETAWPGFLSAKLAEISGRIDARLAKRYVIPVPAPYPEIVLSWVERLTTRDAYLRRGCTPGSKQDEEILARAKAAEDEIREAADAKDGLFDLPTLQASKKTDFLGYSENSPYAWVDRNSEAGYGR